MLTNPEPGMEPLKMPKIDPPEVKPKKSETMAEMEAIRKEMKKQTDLLEKITRNLSEMQRTMDRIRR